MMITTVSTVHPTAWCVRHTIAWGVLPTGIKDLREVATTHRGGNCKHACTLYPMIHKLPTCCCCLMPQRHHFFTLDPKQTTWYHTPHLVSPWYITPHLCTTAPACHYKLQ